MLRDGNLYLSLDDAIALALENNLDIAYMRYQPLVADTDILRARAGFAVRNLIAFGQTRVCPREIPPPAALASIPGQHHQSGTITSFATGSLGQWRSIGGLNTISGTTVLNSIRGDHFF